MGRRNWLSSRAGSRCSNNIGCSTGRRLGRKWPAAASAYDACLALVADTEAARVIRVDEAARVIRVDASKPPSAVLDTALAAICALRPDLLEVIGE
jgi:hypothetical protein